MVLTTISFLHFIYNFQIFIKNQESDWLPHFRHFSQPQNHKKSQQLNFHVLWNRRSRSRGVAKINFGTPMLHGKHSFCDPHPAWEHDFCILRHLPSEKAFFSFFQHIPSENQKNQQNRTSKLWFGRVGAEVAKSKSAATCHIAPSSTIGTRFSNRTKIDKSIQECV